MPAEKKCPDCGIRPVNEFGKSQCRSDGLQDYCRGCINSRNRKWRRSNPGEAREKDRKWGLKRRYGISLSDYDLMFAKQGGVCASCSMPSGGGKRLAVDHDHVTGRVRSLLCYGCNVAFGLLREDPELIYKLAEYAAIHGPGVILEARQ